MTYRAWCETVKSERIPDGLLFCQAILWLHQAELPLGVAAIGAAGQKIIKIPEKAKNRFGRTVSVIAVGRETFAGRKDVTDVVLPPGLRRLPDGAFAGCEALKNLSLPKSVKKIGKRTFEGCAALENVYYEGSPEEWKAAAPGGAPGNAAVHFRCDLTEALGAYRVSAAPGQDITDAIRSAGAEENGR